MCHLVRFSATKCHQVHRDFKRNSGNKAAKLAKIRQSRPSVVSIMVARGAVSSQTICCCWYRVLFQCCSTIRIMSIEQRSSLEIALHNHPTQIRVAGVTIDNLCKAGSRNEHHYLGKQSFVNIYFPSHRLRKLENDIRMRCLILNPHQKNHLGIRMFMRTIPFFMGKLSGY